MGAKFPVTPDLTGDDPTVSPSSGDRSLLAAAASGAAKRLLVDANQNLNVNIAAGNGLDVITRIDYSGGTLAVYVGEALPGTATSAAGWRIKMIAYDGSSNPVSVLWAGSTSQMTQVWDNRGSLTYG